MITINCEKAVAFDSPDHIMPWGTRKDNSRNKRFNEKLYGLYGGRILTILDMGCSGGGFVKDCIDDGNVAIGLEGSDFSKKTKRAEWRTIPEALFTCDITRGFTIYDNKQKMLFDVITAWEVMEHIKEDDISHICDNVQTNLKLGGLWIMSISMSRETINGIDLHQTIKPRTWWIEQFAKKGFVHLDVGSSYFNGQYIRGKELPDSFHLVLTNNKANAPKFPRLSMKQKIIDAVVGSKVQRLMKY